MPGRKPLAPSLHPGRGCSEVYPGSHTGQPRWDSKPVCSKPWAPTPTSRPQPPSSRPDLGQGPSPSTVHGSSLQQTGEQAWGAKRRGCSPASSGSTDTTAAPHWAWRRGPAPHSRPRLHSPMGPRAPWRRLVSRGCQGLLLITLGPPPCWQLGPGPIPHTWLARQPLPPTQPRHSGQLFHLCSPSPPCPTLALTHEGPGRGWAWSRMPGGW